MPPSPSSPDRPLVSVVIPTFNRRPYLERCFDSVFAEIDQDYPNCEVIVIDGGSADGSIEVLQKYSSRLAYWVSERDAGVSDGVNKGIAKARGEIVRILGSDDELIPGRFSQAIQRFVDDPALDVLIGRGEFFAESSSGERTPIEMEQPLGPLSHRDFLRLGESGVGWPSPEVSFTRRRVFDKMGGFSLEFRYLAYLEFWLRITKAGFRCEAVSDHLARRYLTPSSDTVKGARDAVKREHKRLIWQHGGLSYFVRAEDFRRQPPWRALWRIARRAQWFVGLYPKELLRRVLGTQS